MSSKMYLSIWQNMSFTNEHELQQIGNCSDFHLTFLWKTVNTVNFLEGVKCLTEARFLL